VTTNGFSGNVRAGGLVALLLIASIAAGVAVVPAEGATTSELRLEPANGSVGVGSTATFEVVLDPADGGVGSYDINVSVKDTSDARIVAAQTTVNTSFETIQLAPDGSEVNVQAVGGDTADTGSVTVLTVTVEGEAMGTAELSILPDSVGDEGGNVYTISGTHGATVTVTGSDPVTTETFVVDDDGGPTSSRSSRRSTPPTGATASKFGRGRTARRSR
jgi:hypothetical protein